MLVKAQKAADALFIRDCNKYREEIYRYCAALLKGNTHAAEDCVQNAFVVLYTRLGSGETIQNSRAFLYRTADNFVRKQWEQDKKNSRRIVPLSEAEELSSAESIAELPEDFDYEAAAQKLISTLSESEKTLYRFRYIEKRPYEECAELLGISFAATAMRLTRLRKKMTEAVKETLKQYYAKGAKENV